MIDIHSHIVFDVDDGPKSIEESKSLLREAYSKGLGPLFLRLIVGKGCLRHQKRK